MTFKKSGEDKGVLQDMQAYKEKQETLALLKILSLGQQQISTGEVESAKSVLARLRAKNLSER